MNATTVTDPHRARLIAADWAEAMTVCPPELRDTLATLPVSWMLRQIGEDGIMCETHMPDCNLRVICSWSIVQGKRWWHVSVSCSHIKTPTYKHMCIVKAAFIGEDRKAIQIFVPKAMHVNIAEVLHLWHCIDGDGLPEFSAVVNGRRTI